MPSFSTPLPFSDSIPGLDDWRFLSSCMNMSRSARGNIPTASNSEVCLLIFCGKKKSGEVAALGPRVV